MAIANDRLFAEGYGTPAMLSSAQMLLVFLPGFPWGVWLPYLTATLVLAIGLYTARKDFAQKQGLDKLVALGPVFIAVPITLFGTEHFTAVKIVAGMVPEWIPGHMFWALFVGTCLIAAGLSIAARKHARLAVALLGVMILLFVLLIHIPGIAGDPRSRILWAVGVRDLAFAGGAFSLAAGEREGWREQDRQRVVTLARLVFAVAITFFGVQQFLHPELVSGVPLERSTPLWIPARLLWSYLTGAVFVVTGLSMMINKKVRLAATAAALMALVLLIVIYLPIVVSKPSDIGNGLNYFGDTLLLCGSLLAIAEAQRRSLPLDYLGTESEPPTVEARVRSVS